MQDGAAGTERHRLYCFSLYITSHNYNTCNVCGACFAEAQSLREYFIVSQSVSHRGTHTHTLKSRPKSVINKILEHEWEEYTGNFHCKR